MSPPVYQPEMDPVYLCVNCGHITSLQRHHVLRARCGCNEPELHLASHKVAQLAQATIRVDHALNEVTCKWCGCIPCIGPFCPKV